MIASFSGAPLWLAVTALAVEVVGFGAFVLLTWALWPDRSAPGAVDPSDGATVATVVVRCGQCSLDMVRGTVLAARSVGPVVLLDDAQRPRPDLAEMAAGDGLHLHRPAQDESVDPLVSVARSITTDVLVLLDAGQVPAPDLVSRLLCWFEPDVAVVQERSARSTVDVRASGVRRSRMNSPWVSVLVASRRCRVAERCCGARRSHHSMTRRFRSARLRR